MGGDRRVDPSSSAGSRQALEHKIRVLGINKYLFKMP